MRRWLSVTTVLSVLTASLVAGCGSAETDSATTLRLGYFPNLTHASAIVGIEKGFFAHQLGAGITLRTNTFNAGPAAVEALFSNAVDAVYIGPNPTVNAFTKSHGKAIRVISGSASGGVAFVVKPSITDPAQLRGKKISTPQIGNTQDVALRYWLREHGLDTTKEGGGDVNIIPQANSVIVDAFISDAIDGAWVPEPYVSRMVAAGGKILVDERDLWPDRRFVITNLVVRADYLDRHRDLVKRLLAGQVEANEFINASPADARQTVAAGIERLSGKPLDRALIDQAWTSLEFTNDPIASSLITGARHAAAVGLLAEPKLTGLYDLSLLNEILQTAGQTAVRS